jgi:hypothetical protein
MTAAYEQVLVVFRALSRARNRFRDFRSAREASGDAAPHDVWSEVDPFRYGNDEGEGGMSWMLNLHCFREDVEAYWEFGIELDHPAGRCRVLGESGFQHGYGEHPLRHVEPIEVMQLAGLAAAVDSVLDALFRDVDGDFRLAKEAQAAELRELDERRRRAR